MSKKAPKQLLFTYLWEDPELLKPESSTSDDFIMEMLKENLDHARHVENERMTFFSCITAMVAAIIAFGGGCGHLAQIALYLVAFIASIMAQLLNQRWNETFGTHMAAAKGCYYILACRHFGGKEALERRMQIAEENIGRGYVDAPKYGKKNNEAIRREAFNQELCLTNAMGQKTVMSDIPLYAFGVDKSVYFGKVDKTHTTRYFTLYYTLLALASLAIAIYTIIAGA